MPFRPVVLAAVAVAAPSSVGQPWGSGPGSWGTGLQLGPAALTSKNPNDGTSAADEWRAGLAPERSRFSSYDASGPPTTETRQLSSALAQAFDCRICQLLVRNMWEELQEPSRAAMEKWLSEGCTSIVRRLLLQEGWELTQAGCDGAGKHVHGKLWCMIQDSTREVIRYPELCKAYNPPYDAMFLACESTLGSYSRTSAAYLVSNRNGTPPMVRNEHLANRVCIEAARCSKADPTAEDDNWYSARLARLGIRRWAPGSASGVETLKSHERRDAEKTAKERAAIEQAMNKRIAAEKKVANHIAAERDAAVHASAAQAAAERAMVEQRAREDAAKQVENDAVESVSLKRGINAQAAFQAMDVAEARKDAEENAALVAIQANHIADARNATEQAVAELDAARQAAQEAYESLQRAIAEEAAAKKAHAELVDAVRTAEELELSCAVPVGVSHSASSAGSWIESGGKWEPICQQGYKSTVSYLHCVRGVLIPSVFACMPDPNALSPPPIAISTYPEDML